MKLIPTDNCGFLREDVFQKGADATRALERLDEIIPTLKITADKPGTGLQNYKLFKTQPDVNVAISSLQGASNAGSGSITIAIIGEQHAYREPKPGELPFSVEPLLIKQLGKAAATEMVLEIKEDEMGEQAFAKAMAKHMRARADWDVADQDRQRAEHLMRLAEGGGVFGNPSMILIERKLSHNQVLQKLEAIHEEDVLPRCEESSTPVGRSIALAAYIFLCVAGGNQTEKDLILVFIGSRHADMIDIFEEFVSKSKTITWLGSRPRHHVVIPSFVR